MKKVTIRQERRRLEGPRPVWMGSGGERSRSPLSAAHPAHACRAAGRAARIAEQDNLDGPALIIADANAIGGGVFQDPFNSGMKQLIAANTFLHAKAAARMATSALVSLSTKTPVPMFIAAILFQARASGAFRSSKSAPGPSRTRSALARGSRGDSATRARDLGKSVNSAANRGSEQLHHARSRRSDVARRSSIPAIHGMRERPPLALRNRQRTNNARQAERNAGFAIEAQSKSWS